MNARMINDMFIEEEIRRVYPEKVHGEQFLSVQSDMRDWALRNGSWNDETKYNNIVNAYGESRGWFQEHFNGLEVCQLFVEGVDT